MKHIVRSEDFTERDMALSPVWEYCGNEDSESDMAPVTELPVSSLMGCIVGTHVVFADGSRHFAMLSNVELINPALTRHIIHLSLRIRQGGWISFAHYSALQPVPRAAEQFASKLGKSTGDIFPIQYDISNAAVGSPEVVKAVIPAQLDQTWSSQELMAGIVEEARSEERERREKRSVHEPIAPTSPCVPPRLVVFILCDAVIKESSGKLTLAGCFSEIPAMSFPAYYPCITMYVALTSGHGAVRVVVRLTDVDEERAPLYEESRDVSFLDPCVVCEVIFKTGSVTFPAPGEYRLQLSAGGTPLAERRISVQAAATHS